MITVNNIHDRPSIVAIPFILILFSFTVYYIINRISKYFRVLENLRVELNENAQSRLRVIEERRKMEREYYSVVIENLENSNRAVQEEAQALRLHSLRLRNLYEKKTSFMSPFELEKAISELAPRLADMRTSLKAIKARASNASNVSNEPNEKECPICCIAQKPSKASKASKSSTMCSCRNVKCKYEWCQQCDKNIDKCPGCRSDI